MRVTLTLLVRYLGFNVKRTKEGFIFDQTDLIGKLATRAGRCKGNTPVKITPIRSKPKLEKHPLTPGDRDELKQYPFRSHLGVTGYVTVGTRNDGAFACKTLASFNDCHGPTHRKALDDFISYLALASVGPTRPQLRAVNGVGLNGVLTGDRVAASLPRLAPLSSSPSLEWRPPLE